MFQGSTSAPQAMPRWSRSSTCGQPLGGLGELAALDEQLAGGQVDVHLGEHAHRGDGRCAELAPAGGGVAQLGEEQRQVAPLQLQRPLLAQVLVERLPGAAERLPRQRRLLLAAARACAAARAARSSSA